MSILPSFPDAERVVADAVSDLAVVGSETDTQLQYELPYIQIVRVGGADDRITDRARIDVYVYATAAATAKQLAECVRQRLISGPTRTRFGVIDRVVTEVGPQSLPPVDPELRRVVATYRVSMRRHSGGLGAYRL